LGEERRRERKGAESCPRLLEKENKPAVPRLRGEEREKK